MKKAFLFEIGDNVKINVSNEHGTVIGCAQFLDSDHQYLIRYCAGDGRGVEQWWQESALVSA